MSGSQCRLSQHPLLAVNTTVKSEDIYMDMSNRDATSIVKDFLMEKRGLDSEVYEAIKVQYLVASAIADKEGKV